MKKYFHLLIIATLVSPIVYLNLFSTPKVDIQEPVRVTKTKSSPEYVKYFPLDPLATKDLSKTITQIEAIKDDVTGDSGLVSMLSDYLKMLHVANSSSFKQKIISLQNSVIEFDQWQKGKDYKAIDHYISQVKNLVSLYGRSIFYIKTNHLTQIYNLIVDIKNRSPIK